VVRTTYAGASEPTPVDLAALAVEQAKQQQAATALGEEASGHVDDTHRFAQEAGGGGGGGGGSGHMVRRRATWAAPFFSVVLWLVAPAKAVRCIGGRSPVDSWSSADCGFGWGN